MQAMMNKQLIINNATLLAAKKELYSRSLAEFVKAAWPVIEPSNKYIHGWHVEAICEHLEAISNGQINRLLINVPPGTMKSTLVSVFWPAWEWGAKEKPSIRFIGASHEQGVAVRDNMRMRRIIESEWFQSIWPLQMRKDQNEKTYYENEKTGFRQACAVKSMTGRRADRVIWDDPHSAEGALSDADRITALRVFQETLQTRLTNPISSAIVIVMQRLHQEDVAGHILENCAEYEKLILPMEFEPDRRCSTSIGFTDPRTEEDELLFPERFPRSVVDRDKAAMGEYAVASQFQQRPAPRGGAMFSWEKVTIIDVAPKMAKIIRYWDKAGTQDGGAYTAGVMVGKGQDGNFYILDVVRGQWKSSVREPKIKAVAEMDGLGVEIWIEQEGGSGGKESAESTIKNLAGYNIHAERPTGEKSLRAEPASVQVNAGNVFMLRGEWNKDFIDEMKLFPMSKYKDQIDAFSGAFNKLNVSSPKGLLLPNRIANGNIYN